ncbi:MAG TPA: transglycosylase SLT domain-containing protein [Longimicrobiaceae bacterium]|nr:transglycosylase SLT domain-containing protein [Longimicrobiaceae bacterium]
MQLRTALPVALLLGSALGAATAASSGPGSQPAARMGLVREAVATSPVSWDIPVVRNAAVERFVAIFTGSQADEMEKYLKQSGRYEGMIRAKLRARGMPEDLVYLTMIESGFNPTARSRVNAVGLWQFMAPTARAYGLRVDEHVDERRDPEKSTDAALRHLRDLHAQFDSWYLTAAAYNSGAGRVGRVMRSELGRERGQGEGDFWRIRHRLPRETREYVPLMLAAALIGKEPQQYGMGDVERWMPLEADTVRVPGETSLAVVGKAVGVSERELARLNPQLVKKMTPPGAAAYPVRIPPGRTDRFAADFPRLHAEAAARAAAEARVTAARRAEVRRAEVRRPEARRVASRRTHTVRNGESLWTIARRNDTSVRALQRANGLGSRSSIRPGQKLRIPT